MCLLAIVFERIPGCPLFLAANREESYARSSLPPAVVDDPRRWLGGRDAVAGGTWLGVNDRGLVVAVTNRRELPPQPSFRSRGSLCRDLLAASSVVEGLNIAKESMARDRYAGFNLLIADRSAGLTGEFTGTWRERPLKPGVTAITNAPIDGEPHPRAARALAELDRIPDGTALSDWVTGGIELCRRHEIPGQPAMCLHGPAGGTVSSTILALTDPPAPGVYLYAEGPPCETEYRDLSGLLAQITCKGQLRIALVRA